MRTGIDIVEIERISLDDKFLSKIANEREIEYIKTYKTEQSQKESIAGLWAVKEAVFKLLGLGKNSGVAFKDIELLHEANGRPYVKLINIAEKTFINLGLKEIEISISHTKNNAVAVAIAQ